MIKTHAYSLWLNDVESNSGSILFGGVDTAKYHSPLLTLPIQKVRGRYSAFVVALTSLSLTTGSTQTFSKSSFPFGVLLDSGTTLTYLPTPVVQEIYKNLQATYDSSRGVGFVSCNLANQNGHHFTYTFTSANIQVSMDELVMPWSGLTFQDGSKACEFGIAPGPSNTYVLGDTFLRSAYVVFDMDQNEISIANTNFNAKGTNIKEIGTGSAPIPGATRVSNPVTTIGNVNPTAVIGIHGSMGAGTQATVTSTVVPGKEKSGGRRTRGRLSAVLVIAAIAAALESCIL